MKRFLILATCLLSSLLFASGIVENASYVSPDRADIEDDISGEAKKLEEGLNILSLKDDEVLMAIAIYTPDGYPEAEPQSFSLSLPLSKKAAAEDPFTEAKKEEDDSDITIATVEAAQDEVARARKELCYEGNRIRYYFLIPEEGSTTIKETSDEMKALYLEELIPQFNDYYETVLEEEPRYFFDREYPDANGDGYFSIYIYDYEGKSSGYVSKSEAKTDDVYHLNSAAGAFMRNDEERLLSDFAAVFPHEYFHYLQVHFYQQENMGEFYNFVLEGMANAAGDWAMQTFLGMAQTNVADSKFFLIDGFHPEAHGKHPAATSPNPDLEDYFLGGCFWHYIRSTYGIETYRTMITMVNKAPSTIIEEVLHQPFSSVYREFLMSAFSGADVSFEGRTPYEGSFYDNFDEWILLNGAYLGHLKHGQNSLFLQSKQDSYQNTIEPCGFSFVLMPENPEALWVEKGEDVDIYVFTIRRYFYDYLVQMYDL